MDGKLRGECWHVPLKVLALEFGVLVLPFTETEHTQAGLRGRGCQVKECGLWGAGA